MAVRSTSPTSSGDPIPTALAVAGIGPDVGARYTFCADGTADRLTVLDPNIRPAVVPDGHRRRFRELLPSIGIVTASDDDVRWLGHGPDGSTPQQWLEAGVRTVVTTHGADGSSVRTPRLQVRVPAVGTTVVDTIGAGETVHGALLARLAAHDRLDPGAVGALEGGQWRRALEFAARAAAITVSRPGADPPWATELTGG